MKKSLYFFYFIENFINICKGVGGKIKFLILLILINCIVDVEKNCIMKFRIFVSLLRKMCNVFINWVFIFFVLVLFNNKGNVLFLGVVENI